MADAPGRTARLIITADDWGYSQRYNAGIEEAARAGAVDSVSAMVTRAALDPAPLIEGGVEVGLHIERPATDDHAELLDAPKRQAEAFESVFGRPPAYIDGHHHCHAELPVATAAEDLALELGIPVRAVGADHRYRLVERGIATADRLMGRLNEGEPALPRMLAVAIEEEALPPGTTEWVVHPGHSDRETGSSYDRGREEDLELVLELASQPTLARARATHREALAA